MRCQKCTLINEPEAFTCKSCGMSLRPTHTPASYSPVSQNNGKGLKQGLAITSLVLGIVSVPLFCAGFLLAIPGIITGIIALVKISKEPAIYGGKGMAIGGIATGAFSLVFMIPIMAAIAIPNMLAARKSANEFAALGRLRTIASAQVTYAENANKYGTIKELIAANLLDTSYDQTVITGYKLTLTVTGDNSYEAVMTPETTSSGGRSFYISEDGVVHFSTVPGKVADDTDPVLAPSGKR